LSDPSAPAIHVRDLGKRFRLEPGRRAHERLEHLLRSPARLCKHRPAAAPTWVLRDVSFDLHPSEIVALVGCNGSGKSVLLKILSRVLKPTEGHVTIRGRVASILDVGTGFHPDLTGRENLFLSGVILGMKRVEVARAFDEIVAFAEVEKYLDIPVKRYSSGMKMRLALAVCAQFERDVVLLDEVLAVADEGFQRRYIARVAQVASEGCAVLMVSHDAQAVERLCARAILLDGGRIAANGPSREVFDRYHELLSAAE
jgi:lipopolysaccharide transport system ATP-binding protein